MINKCSTGLWLKRIGVVATLPLLSLASCSTSEPLLLPALTQDLKAKTQDGLANQLKASGEVQFNLSVDEIPEPVSRLLLDAKHLSLLESSSSVSMLGAGISAVLSLKKKYDTPPSPIPLPAFASGKTFLPLNEAATEFWMVSSEAASVKIVRPVRSLTSAAEPLLPEHMLAQLSANATPIGFGVDHLLLANSDSLWIVKKDGSKLTVNEVASPAANAAFISAGALSGSKPGFWFATGTKIWVVQPQGQDWSAQEFSIKLTGLTGTLSSLNAVFELSGEQLKVQGAVLARVGEKMGSSGVEISLADPSPVPAGTAQPNGAAMTFAEAQMLCNGCHATTSGNNAAKAKLVGTENIATWMTSKIAIADEVVNNRMPPGKNWDQDPAEKMKFLNFANNPVQ